MAALYHQIWIDAPRDKVYAAISTADGVSSWWDDQIERETDDGLIWEHTPGPEHGTVQFKVLERSEGERVRWKTVSEHKKGVPGHEWTGTTISFTLKDRADHPPVNEKWCEPVPVQTVLLFEHDGWADDATYFGFCNSAWGEVLAELKRACEEG